MAVSYPSLRDDGLNLAPPYPEPIQNQDSSIGIWTDMSYVSGDSSRTTTRTEIIQAQELSLSLGAEICTEPAPRAVEYHHHHHQYYSSYHGGAYQCHEPAGLANGSSVLHSKYLKPVQVLLDETVSIIRKASACKQKSVDENNKFLNVRGSHDDSINDSKENDIGQFIKNQSILNPGNSFESLSPEEKQDLQNRKTKLLAMLDEVDKRYGEYYHEMQSLISSFEIVAGFGAAKPYTSVALQRLSRTFRSLRDAIKTQIRVVRSKLGEQETGIDDQGDRIPRLRYVDQQMRLRRTYHQIGTMRPVWRPPQRGLPENSVSILRAWLFEHFLHPYPKDSEKIMLAKQTGLTRNQVANWFINARVRLWKPMIEQMYREEFGDPEEVNPPLLTSLQENSTERRQQRESVSHDPHELQTNMDTNEDEISRSLVGSNMADYRYMLLGMAAHHQHHHHQDRFTDPHQFHDFVV